MPGLATHSLRDAVESLLYTKQLSPAKQQPHAFCTSHLLDRETRRVRRGARDIHLGPTEFRLLEYLLEKPGRVFSRAQLLDGVWGQAAEIDERTVDVHVGRLRKALSRGRERDPIRTVRGTGYAFDETFGKP